MGFFVCVFTLFPLFSSINRACYGIASGLLDKRFVDDDDDEDDEDELSTLVCTVFHKGALKDLQLHLVFFCLPFCFCLIAEAPILSKSV